MQIVTLLKDTKIRRRTNLGSGGPGNIVHIDNLYVKTLACKTNIDIKIGEFLIFDTDGYRPLLSTDFSADNTFLGLHGTAAGSKDGIVQALEDANNLTATPVNDRKPEVSVAMQGTDWVVKMEVGARPTRRVGISRLDARTPVIAVDIQSGVIPANPTLDETLGIYKHKEFARLAEISVLNDDGVVSTGP